MLLAVRISSYGCTWDVWRALKKLELLSAAPRATLTRLSCSPNFPRASITRYTHAKHEPILKFSQCKSRFIFTHKFFEASSIINFNTFAVTLVNSEEMVGHLTREYSRIAWYFLARGGSISRQCRSEQP